MSGLDVLNHDCVAAIVAVGLHLSTAQLASACGLMQMRPRTNCWNDYLSMSTPVFASIFDSNGVTDSKHWEESRRAWKITRI